MKKNNIAVIGAGIVGSSLAFHLSTYGKNVTVFDKGLPGSGATGHSFAWINAFGKLPRHYFDLNHRSMDLWSRFNETLGVDVGLKWGGNVTYYADRQKGQELLDQCERLQSWGYPIQTITQEELAELEPNLNIGPFFAGIHTLTEGHVIPTRVAEACMAKVQENGGDIYLDTSVESIVETAEEVILNTQREEFKFDKVVIAAGVDSTNLATSLGINLPQRVSPGIVTRTAPLPPIMETLSTIYLPPGPEDEGEIHIRQATDGSLMCGAGDQENENDDDSQEYADFLLKRASRYFRSLDGVQAERVPVGLRPMPEDGLPVLGFPNKSTRIYITLMHSGVTLAPIVGALGALEIATESSVDSLQPYRPTRFN